MLIKTHFDHLMVFYNIAFSKIIIRLLNNLLIDINIAQKEVTDRTKGKLLTKVITSVIKDLLIETLLYLAISKVILELAIVIIAFFTINVIFKVNKKRIDIVELKIDVILKEVE
jgi:hypothetical protein